MWPFPKSHFEWREPKEFRRALNAREGSKTRWWTKPLLGCALGCIFLAQWGVAKLAGSQQAPSLGAAVSVSFAAGTFLIYFTSWAYQVFPTSVMILDDRVYRIIGNSREEWTFAKIQSYAVFEWSDSRVLAIFSRDGGHAVIGVPPRVDLPGLQAFLDGRGLSRVPAQEALQRTLPSAGR